MHQGDQVPMTSKETLKVYDNQMMAKSPDEIGRVAHDARYLCFSLAAEEFAVPLLHVREVVTVPDCTRIPFAPDYVAGIMNVRGQIITVIDLRKRLSVATTNLTEESAVILFDIGGHCIGGIVDNVNHVLSPDLGQLFDKPELELNSKSRFISKIYRNAEQLITILDVTELLKFESPNQNMGS